MRAITLAAGFLAATVCSASVRQVELLEGIVLTSHAESVANGFHLVSQDRPTRGQIALQDPRNLLNFRTGDRIAFLARATGQVSYNQLPFYLLEGLAGGSPLAHDASSERSDPANFRGTSAGLWGSLQPSPSRTVQVPTDVDGDGMTDAFEAFHGLRVDLNDSRLDPDGDGVTNGDEAIIGSDPQNGSSAFHARFGTVPGGPGLRLSWDGKVGRSYQPYIATRLGGTWTAVGSPIKPGLEGPLFIDLATQTRDAFYKIEALLEPQP